MEMNFNLDSLHAFIIRAKKATYVGNGAKASSSRRGSHDLTFSDGPYNYRDSYFGGIDFLGQEVVWLDGAPVWAMNYYGYILKPELITAEKAGHVIKTALSAPHSQGRLLDNFESDIDGFAYAICSEGNVAHFSGREIISSGGTTAYQLDYHGGLVKE
jgi:hypothetical protein